MNIKKTANWSRSVCRLHDNTTVSFMGSGHSSCIPRLRSCLWLIACCCVVDIRQWTATTRDEADSCKRNSAMERRAQVQSYVIQTELTSELNLQCNYFTFVGRTTDMEKTANMNW